MGTWRVGRKLGRTLYVDGVCVGMVDTPALALAIVAAMNGTVQCVHLDDPRLCRKCESKCRAYGSCRCDPPQQGA
jgi:hypothetical protein